MSHALLSPSSAYRWLECTASPHYEEAFPDKGSAYAAEGTLAHSVAELKLRKYAIEPMSQRTYHTRLNKLKKHELWQNEMEDHTETYLDYIKSIALKEAVMPHIAAETKLDLSNYAPDCFGTADCLIMTGNTLHVIDFKYGKGVPVSAENNPQMMLYALGALAKYVLIYKFSKVVMTIVQPRLNNISAFELPTAELLTWGDSVKAIATEAFNGPGEFKPGEHCKFCRGKLQCKARNDYYADMKELPKSAPLNQITLEEIARYLPIADALKNWAEDLKEYALSCCLDGKNIPGYKAVEGRGKREFTSLDDAFKVLMANSIDEAMLYNRVPLTLAQAEKVVGPKKFGELLSEFIIKVPGKPTLASESDKRPAIGLMPVAENLFKKIGGIKKCQIISL